MKKILAMFMLIGLIVPPFASAEMIQGTISALNLSANSFYITHIDSTTGFSKEVKVYVEPDAKFRGADSLSEFEAGDKVRIDADTTTQGTYEAREVAAVMSVPAEESGKPVQGGLLMSW